MAHTIRRNGDAAAESAQKRADVRAERRARERTERILAVAERDGIEAGRAEFVRTIADILGGR